MLPLDAGVIDAASPGGHPVNWVATGRSGGVSEPPYAGLNLADHVGDDPRAVRRNRELCTLHAGLAPDRLAVLDAVHGSTVALATDGGIVTQADAVVSTQRGLVLLALAADCVPLALADPDAGVIAAVHCGWRGLSAGVVPNAISAMRDLGARSISAVLGPSICAPCYPVPEDRVQQVRAGVPPSVAAAACPALDGMRIDVAAGVRAQLSMAAVPSRTVAGCTAESDALYSYRRDGVTGRQGMMVWQ